MQKATACGSPFVELTSLVNGVKLACYYYCVKGVIVVVLPIVFNMNMKGPYGGIDGKQQGACQFPGGRCHDFGEGPEGRHEMWNTMSDPEACAAVGGTHVEIEEEMNDHSMGDGEAYFMLRAITIFIAACCCALNLKAMAAGDNQYLSPLVRALIVLCVVEMIAEVFSHMAIDGRCEDPAMRTGMHCAMQHGSSSTATSSTAQASGSTEINLSSPAMQCEDQQTKFDLGLFAVGLLINSYNCWIVHSYESTVRGGGSGVTASLSDSLPA